MKRHFIIAVLIFFIYGCKDRNKDLSSIFTQTEYKMNNEIKYNLNDLFNEDSLNNFYEAASIKQKDSANLYFMQAINYYKNLNKLDSAKTYFEQSLAFYPDGNTFYEYGNLLLDTKNYDEAISAFNMSEAQNFQPVSNILYNIGRAYALKKDYDSAFNYLQFSLQAGYSNIDNIFKNNDIKDMLINNTYYKVELVKEVSSITDDKDILYFNSFKDGFPILTNTMYVNLQVDTFFNSLNDISYEYEKYITEMRTADKFSREVGKYFYYYTQIQENENYIALIYVVRDYLNYDLPTMNTMFLTTYTKNGNIIDKKLIAGLDNIKQPYKICKVDEHGSINIKNYSTAIKKAKDTYTKYFEMVDLIGSEKWKIDNNGKIVPFKMATM